MVVSNCVSSHSYIGWLQSCAVQTSFQNKQKQMTLICSIYQFPWCESSQGDKFQATNLRSTNGWVGRMHTIIENLHHADMSTQIPTRAHVMVRWSKFTRKRGVLSAYYL